MRRSKDRQSICCNQIDGYSSVWATYELRQSNLTEDVLFIGGPIDKYSRVHRINIKADYVSVSNGGNVTRKETTLTDELKS